MPELPEVETVKNTLKELTLHKEIKSVEVYYNRIIDSNVDEFLRLLPNNEIIDFERVGKFIIFHLTNDLVLISHLRMEGKYFLKNEDEIKTKHDLMCIHFKDGTKLMYNDTRKFGRIKLSSKDRYMKEEPLCNVGPDPFMMKDSKRLIDSFRNKSIAIKTALLDQTVMSGLGNIYVDEVLFECKIHPETPAKLVSKTQLDSVLKYSKIILQKAITAGGTTIKSYHPREGISGNFQVDLKAYGKKGNKCPRCGNELRKIFVNGRGTTYCPKCQKNPSNPLIYGLTGPIAAGKSTVSNAFKNHGFKVIDCDKVVHDLYKDKQVQQHLIDMFSSSVIQNNDVDRKYLKMFILEHQNKKRVLEKYIHAKVTESIEKEIKNSKQPVLIEAPLLFESKLDLLCDEIVYIDVTKERQIENLKARGSDVESSLKLNESFDKKNAKKKATIIINNDSDVANLNKQIDSIFCK